MISKVRSAFRSDFVKVSYWSGMATVVKMIANLLVSKILAYFVGPTGFATIGQFQNGINIFLTLSTGGIGSGVTKYVSEYQEQSDLRQKFINIALKISVFCSIITSFIVIAFSHSIAQYLLGDTTYQSILVLFALGLTAFSINSTLLSILNGFKSFQVFIRVSIVGALLGMTLTAILTITLNLYGALLSYAISQSIIVVFTCWALRKTNWLTWSFWKQPFEWTIVKQLLSYSAMALVTTLNMPTSQLLVRSYIVENLSQEKAGIWEGMNKISAMYLMLITTSITTYYLPRLSEIPSNQELIKEVQRTFKLVLPVLLALSFLVFLLKDIIIYILFTPEFLPMRDLFSVQLVGDIFKMSGWLLAYVLLAKAMTKAFILVDIVFSVSFVLFSISFVKLFGLIGATYAYTLNYFIYAIVLWIYINKKYAK